MSNSQQEDDGAERPGAETQGEMSKRRYQLTHDYLVPSLREWLTRKRRETMRGRASLLLESQAELWSARPERRYLPSLVEWAAIGLLTRKSEWTQLERKMMRLATRVQLTRLVLFALLFVAVLAGGLTVKAYFDKQRRQSMELVDSLVSELLVAEWERVPEITEKLRPYCPLWRDRLSHIADDSSRSPDQHARAQVALAQCGSERLPHLVDRLFDASTDGREYRVLFPVLSAYPEELSRAAERELGRSAAAGSERDVERLAKRKSSAAITQMRLGRSEQLWPLLECSEDPRLRTLLIHRAAPFGVAAKTLLDRLDLEASPSIRQAILLALGEYPREGLPPAHRQRAIKRCDSLYRSDPDPGVHAGAEWLLRGWEQEERLQAACAELAGPSAGDWYVNGQLQTMVVLRRPHHLPEWSWHVALQDAGTGSVDDADRDFAISAHEVTIEQFHRFRAEAAPAEDVSPDPRCPVNRVTWHEAAQYCRWLSQVEGVPEVQMCYPPIDQIAPGMPIADDCLSRTGYRLPTQAEWEIACRAGTSTKRFFGESDEMLPHYAWFDMNSDGHLWPVGKLKPNPFGLFDTCGNVMEWCHGPLALAPVSSRRATTASGAQEAAAHQVLPVARGGAYRYRAQDADPGNRHPFDWITTASFLGFRVARTIEEGGGPPPPGLGGDQP